MPGLYDQGALLNSGAAFMRGLAEPDQQAELLGLRQQEANTNQYQVALAARKQQEESQRRTAYQGKVAELLQNPSAGAMAALAAQFPEYGSEAKAAFDGLDEKKRGADLKSMGEVYSALSAGKTDIAVSALRRRIEADRAAGDVDEEDQRILTELESGDPQRVRAAMTYIGIGMAQIAPKEFAAAFGAINKASEPNLRSVSPGDIVYDERTGQKVFESPFRPTTQTITDPNTGQVSVIQLQSGGGDQSSSLPSGVPDLTGRSVILPMDAKRVRDSLGPNGGAAFNEWMKRNGIVVANNPKDRLRAEAEAAIAAGADPAAVNARLAKMLGGM